MLNSRECVAEVGSFAVEFGDLQAKPRDIPGFQEIWQSLSTVGFELMGCDTYRVMTGPILDYVVRCVGRTLSVAEVDPTVVDGVVFATSDSTLAQLDNDFVAACLGAVGLSTAVPTLLGFQQCCSSLSALAYCRDLIARGTARTVLLIAFDYTAEQNDRVQPYAIFSDAVATCLVGGSGWPGFSVSAAAVGVDHAGLRGEDSFSSRREVAATVLGAVLQDAAEPASVFTTNLFRPVSMFNATVAGLNPETLHYVHTLAAYGHCGNCDWLVNLVDYTHRVGVEPGRTYLAHSSAPGFFGAALLTAVRQHAR